ncbi:similar to Saccharomyces cerevisiae YJR010C-A SPC1 Subunit of the signal peptidase complex (SPC) [Maudiozyma saulgeensis]|uniref:Signal peptidase complex subunit 1 n=1 Tax=Maudiozyma saulgeensis TaxID=1789683 RepID=A0A1X7R6A2_9SACH|nr:similar to Saccharomyces cerevisiae YJR010C-A SPC1 Subunit of the signal peptidase complex (SPC) [Kazachstania saulgeensis]
MSEIVQEINKYLVFPVDYPSQKKLNDRTHILIILFGIISFVYGYVTQSIKNLLICYGVGILITSLIIVPAYPFYNKQKLNFVTPKRVNIDIAE